MFPGLVKTLQSPRRTWNQWDNSGLDWLERVAKTGQSTTHVNRLGCLMVRILKKYILHYAGNVLANASMRLTVVGVCELSK